MHDVKVGENLLSGFDLENKKVLCDKGYDSSALVSYIEANGGMAVIPSRRNSKNPRHIDAHEYRERHLVENLFLKMKNFRRFATRYEKSILSFAAITFIAAILIWLR